MAFIGQTVRKWIPEYLRLMFEQPPKLLKGIDESMG